MGHDATIDLFHYPLAGTGFAYVCNSPRPKSQEQDVEKECGPHGSDQQNLRLEELRVFTCCQTEMAHTSGPRQSALCVEAQARGEGWHASLVFA